MPQTELVVTTSPIKIIFNNEYWWFPHPIIFSLEKWFSKRMVHCRHNWITQLVQSKYIFVEHLPIPWFKNHPSLEHSPICMIKKVFGAITSNKTFITLSKICKIDYLVIHYHGLQWMFLAWLANYDQMNWSMLNKSCAPINKISIYKLLSILKLLIMEASQDVIK